MHAHVASKRKLSRGRDQREALLRGLVTSLVLHEKIETTEAKAKEIVSTTERLITRAKQGGVNNQRTIIKFLQTENAVQKLMYELAPAFKERTGGYTRVVKLGFRRGDNAPLAQISLVLPPKLEDTKASKPTKAAVKAADNKATKAEETKEDTR